MHLAGVSTSSSSENDKLLYSLLLLEGHTVDLGFCDANDKNDKTWSCSSESESECVTDCGGTFIDTAEELKALDYFCFPPFTNHQDADKFKKFRNGHLCNSVHRGQWVATQTLTDNHFLWVCDSKSCTLKYKPGFQIQLGFCRASHCEDNPPGWKWIDAESELRNLGWFCLPSDLSTNNTNRDYEKARNHGSCANISGARWDKDAR